jgi:antitoxin component of MazEF toxin-antitoxin module
MMNSSRKILMNLNLTSIFSQFFRFFSITHIKPNSSQIKDKFNKQVIQCITRVIWVTEVTVKKWGNSLGVILPKEFVNENKIKENDKIDILIARKRDLSDMFGTLKTKMTAQQFKDMVRKGWE